MIRQLCRKQGQNSRPFLHTNILTIGSSSSGVYMHIVVPLLLLGRMAITPEGN